MSSDTFQDPVKHSSFLVTEDLETQDAVIDLGRKMIKNLSLSEPNETAHWMANYLAEKVSKLKGLSGEILLTEKRECFELILKLWSYRDHLPDVSKPFGNYHEIFRALESLDPEASPYRYSSINDDYPESLDEEIKLWLDFSKKIDVLARTMISFSLKEAFNKATDDNIKSWIEAIDGNLPSNEIEIVLRALSNGMDVTNSEDDILKVHKEKLSNRIDQIETFEELSTIIKKMLSDELEELNSNQDNTTNE